MPSIGRTAGRRGGESGMISKQPTTWDFHEV
jgi:hypothetical protein